MLLFWDSLLVLSLIGLSSGLWGPWLYYQRKSLFADMIAHSIFPGVIAGYALSSFEKNPAVILLTALVFSVLATKLSLYLESDKRIDRNLSLSIVIGSTFAMGTLAYSIIDSHLGGVKSGIQSLLVGQASAVSIQDLPASLDLFLLSVCFIFILFHPLRAFVFDRSFSKMARKKPILIQNSAMALIACTVTLNVQSVGVVLSAGLILIPGACAFLIGRSFSQQISASSLVGGISSLLGAYLSLLVPAIPTGPSIILSSLILFFVFWFASPHKGFLSKYFHKRQKFYRILQEDILKALLNCQITSLDSLKTRILVKYPRLNSWTLRKAVKNLLEAQLTAQNSTGYSLSARGQKVARKLIRKHRLWETYMVHTLGVDPSRVHGEAEKLEHLLSDEIIQQIDKKLGYPKLDPHGSVIPSLAGEKL